MRCAPELVLMAALVLPACRDDGDGSSSDDDAAESGGSESGGAEDSDGSDDSGGSDESSGDESGDAGEVDEGPWMTFGERPCPEDSFLTYENFGWPHMLTFCTGCHSAGLPADMRQGAPIEVNFADIEDVRAQAERIWVRAGDHNASMPPVGPADEEERRLLGEWLACGAPTDADLE